MQGNKTKMICPKCGDEMNHHADKIIYSTDRRATAAIDPSLGGLIEETHNCPRCGVIASRIAEQD
jgi:ribosomal protein S27AE